MPISFRLTKASSSILLKQDLAYPSRNNYLKGPKTTSQMKKLYSLGWLLGLIAGFLTACSGPSTTFSADALRCEQDPAPLGVENPQPRFSWQICAQSRGFIQSAYRILVADSRESLDQERGNCWDSGKIRTDEQVLVAYQGKPLQSGRRYWWKVRVWNAQGEASEWSQPATFDMGLLSESDWNGAQWIALEEDIPDEIIVPGMADYKKIGERFGDHKTGLYTLPQFRKTFTPEKPVRRAMVYVCGLGQFEMTVNGTKTGDHFLDPAWTRYDRTALYVPFEITDQLRAGENVLGIRLGNGFFNVPRDRYFKLLTSYGAPKLIAKIALEYEDGSQECFVSDTTWKAAPSAITFSSIYSGEDYDASTEESGWETPGFDDRNWKAALPTSFTPQLRAQSSTPLKITDRIPAVRIFRNRAGNWVYDLGQNASGIVRISLTAHDRQSVKLIPAELLNDDETANQKASGDPFYYTYTARGDGHPETWQPRFTYYGFRYVEVIGAIPAGEPNPRNLPEITEIVGLHTRNSAEETGTFTCSNPLFNRIHDLIDWSIRSNLSHVLTDCPHREKLGWLEVAYLMGPSIQFRYDIARVYAKKVEDMQTAQYENGMIPTTAPQYVIFWGGFLDTPEWGSAYISIPWDLYRWYGDLRPLEENYDNMARYIAYLGSQAENHIISYGLGDWFDIGPGFPGYSQLTTNGVTATATYYRNVKIMEQTARLLNKPTDAERYAALADTIRQAYNDRFFNPDNGYYDRNSQTANAISLVMGLVPSEHVAAVRQHLIDDIRGRGNALTAGDIGYRYVLRALEEGNASDVIYDMNSRYDVPGYGYQLAHGATCLTESWQAYREVSNNHCMLGHLMEWLYSGLVGISQSPTSVAYKEVVIKPQVVGDIYQARGSFRSPYGLIRSEWHQSGDKFIQEAEIPAGCSALVYLPATDPARITESGLPLSEAAQVSLQEQTPAYTIVRIGSGQYRFEVPLTE